MFTNKLKAAGKKTIFRVPCHYHIYIYIISQCAGTFKHLLAESHYRQQKHIQYSMYNTWKHTTLNSNRITHFLWVQQMVHPQTYNNSVYSVIQCNKTHLQQITRYCLCYESKQIAEHALQQDDYHQLNRNEQVIIFHFKTGQSQLQSHVHTKFKVGNFIFYLCAQASQTV